MLCLGMCIHVQLLIYIAMLAAINRFLCHIVTEAEFWLFRSMTCRSIEMSDYTMSHCHRDCLYCFGSIYYKFFFQRRTFLRPFLLHIQSAFIEYFKGYYERVLCTTVSSFVRNCSFEYNFLAFLANNNAQILHNQEKKKNIPSAWKYPYSNTLYTYMNYIDLYIQSVLFNFLINLSRSLSTQ